MGDNIILSPVNIRESTVEQLEYRSHDIYGSSELEMTGVKLMRLYDGELLDEFFLSIVVLFKMRDASSGAPLRIGVTMTGEFECNAEKRLRYYRFAR